MGGGVDGWVSEECASESPSLWDRWGREWHDSASAPAPAPAPALPAHRTFDRPNRAMWWASDVPPLAELSRPSGPLRRAAAVAVVMLLPPLLLLLRPHGFCCSSPARVGEPSTHTGGCIPGACLLGGSAGTCKLAERQQAAVGV